MKNNKTVIDFIIDEIKLNEVKLKNIILKIYLRNLVENKCK